MLGEEPNVNLQQVGMNLFIVAIKDIKKDEELLWLYRNEIGINESSTVQAHILCICGHITPYTINFSRCSKCGHCTRTDGHEYNFDEHNVGNFIKLGVGPPCQPPAIIKHKKRKTYKKRKLQVKVQFRYS
jgi:hypothetical protein